MTEPVVVERRSHVLRNLIGAIVLLLIVAVVAFFVLANRSTDSAKKDVAIASCAADPGGGRPKATGTIKNHSSKSSNYVLTIKFKDTDGNTLSEGVTHQEGVKPDQTVNWTLTGARDAKGQLACTASKVARTHLPGQ